MLMDIFSALDPATNSMLSTQPSSHMFWTLNFMFIFIISSSYWMFPSRLNTMITLTSSIMWLQATRTLGLKLKTFPAIISSLFITIMLMNLHGLTPYSFSVTSHLIFTLTLGLVLWFSIIISSLLNSPMKFTGSLLPSGAPDWLSPILVLIETVSIAVRPITLSFRLAANMSAGHIVLSLVSIFTTAALFSNYTTFFTLTMIQTGYMMFEVGICLVQAYIFTLLLTLYADDHS